MKDDLNFEVGFFVTLDGLLSRKELNGQRGKITKKLPNGRLAIKIQNVGEIVSVHPKNCNISEISDCKIHQKNLLMQPKLNIWRNSPFFYPTGNTPAKFLIQNCPSSVRFPRVLMLGCGDPRHLFLYLELFSDCGRSCNRDQT